jgi:hypothetical protein
VTWQYPLLTVAEQLIQLHRQGLVLVSTGQGSLTAAGALVLVPITVVRVYMHVAMCTLARISTADSVTCDALPVSVQRSIASTSLLAAYTAHHTVKASKD